MAKKSDDKVKRPDYRWQRQNGWHKIDAAEGKLIDAYCRDYLSFLSAAKTEWEAHDIALDLAQKEGYVNIDDIPARTGSIKPGDRIYRTCGGKTLMLAKVGARPLTDGLHLVGGHTDAPRLDSKPNPLYEDGEMALLDTHYYGGIKKYQWVAMPLAIHGMVVRQDGTKVRIVVGEDPGDPVFVITDLLPHLAQEQSKKTMTEGVTGEGLNVLIGSVPIKDKDAKEAIKQNLLTILHDKYDISEEDLTSADIEIVPAGAGRELGFDRSMLLGYGHDDRVCAYAALRALLDLEETPEYSSIVLLCDKEEIGSVGATGMESVFFENSIAELIARSSEPYSDLLVRRSLEKSRMLSADVSALHDPNYPDVSSPNNNMAKLNGGVVMHKYGGSRGKSHSSEASAEFMAAVRRIFNEAGVLWQASELGKVDLGGGGTIAMFLARYGMDVIDCGVGLLSMHAPWEVAGKLDTYMAYKGYKAFLRHRR